MQSSADDTMEMLKRAADPESAAVGELFDHHRDKLKRMIHLRMDHRLAGRLDASDVLQEAFIEYARSLPGYVMKPDVPFYVWLRCITGRKLLALHRQHLGTRMRDAGRELSFHPGGMPEASSVSLAAQLLGKLTTPSQAFLRAEIQQRIQETLAQMEPLDREVLALRHYEQLSNRETAHVLEISEAAASIRFIRALRRLKYLLSQIPGFWEDHGAASSREKGESDELH